MVESELKEASWFRTEGVALLAWAGAIFLLLVVEASEINNVIYKHHPSVGFFDGFTVMSTLPAPLFMAIQLKREASFNMPEEFAEKMSRSFSFLTLSVYVTIYLALAQHL